MSECREGKSNKRILILTNYDVGLYQFRRELLQQLLQQGYDVYISLPNGDFIHELEQMGCHFIDTAIDRRGINPITDLKIIIKYFKILKQIKPDKVITYTIKPNVYGGLACRIKKVPYAVNITGLGTAFQNKGALRTLVTFLYKTALKKAKIIFFENSDNMRVFRELKICKNEQCKLLNGAGVNLQHYRYMQYPDKDCPVHFLFVGRVMKEKGIDELFDAMQRLQDDGENCVLDVLGNYEENYAQTVEKFKSKGWLNYYGYQSDVRPFIEKAHCFVLPSWHEGMANTNLECAASGRPLITADIPGCREAVIDGESGLLCEAKNAESLYKAMKKFMSMSNEQREEMGKCGRKHMEKNFDKNSVVAETLKGLEL